MAALGNQSIASSYEQLLHVDTDGGGNGTTLVDVKDGDNGTTFALKLATDKVHINGSLGVGTASPSTLVHLKSATPALRLEATASSARDYDIKTDGDELFIEGVGGSSGSLQIGENGVFNIQLDLQSSFKLDTDSRISLSNNDGGTGNTVFGNIAGDDLATGGDFNSFFGHNSGHAVTTGDYNVAMGVNAIDGATNPQRVVAIGAAACRGNLTSDAQGTVAVGYAAANALTAGQYNTAIGYESMDSLTVGDRNTAVGYQTLSALTGVDGEQSNTAVGYVSGLSITSGQKNTSMGAESLDGLTTGDSNVAIGHIALGSETIGNQTTAIGAESLYSQNMDADENAKNVGVGTMAGYRNVTGIENTLIGHSAGLGASGQSHSGNTAVGSSALLDITTGGYNTAIGRQAATNLTSGTANIAIGSGAITTATTSTALVSVGGGSLYSINSTDADGSVAVGVNSFHSATHPAGCVGVGYYTGYKVTTGDTNTLVGHYSGYNPSDTNGITTGSGNTSLGAYTMGYSASSDITGSYNTAVGYQALTNIEGSATSNTALGREALKSLTTGSYNIAIGNEAGEDITTGGSNIHIGSLAGDNVSDASHIIAIGDSAVRLGTTTTTANGTVAVGSYALSSLSSGQKNTAIGYKSQEDNTTGSWNTTVGYEAGANLLAGSNNNTAVGWEALKNGNHSATDDNTCIGSQAGDTITGGGDNVCIGSESDVGTNTDNNSIAIGKGAVGKGSNTALIGGASVTDVYQGDNGNTWSQTSDGRLKENIKEWDKGLNEINKLRIVEFNFKKDNPFKYTDKKRQGIIAQEAQKVLPEMVKNDGKWLSANTEPMIWALVKAVQELSSKVTELENKLK